MFICYSVGVFCVFFFFSFFVCVFWFAEAACPTLGALYKQIHIRLIDLTAFPGQALTCNHMIPGYMVRSPVGGRKEPINFL